MNFRPWILALGVFLLLLPIAVRFLHDQPLLAGGESYGHIRIAERIAQTGIPDHDPALPERPYTFNVFDALLAGFLRLFGELGAVLLPALLGIGTLLCLLGIGARAPIPHAAVTSAQLVFVLSPFFVDIFTQATPRALELFLLLFYLFVFVRIEDKKSRVWFGSLWVTAGLLATLGMIPALVAIALPLVLRTVRRLPQAVVGASITASIVFVTVAIPAFLQTEAVAFMKPMPVVLAISDFSGSGLSLFAWLLAIIGVILQWHLKKRYYVAMIMTSVVLAAALLLPPVLIIAHVLVALFAGYALAFFATMKWSFDDIRLLTLFVLVCGLLFSTLAHAMILAQGQPSTDVRDAARAVRDILPQYTLLLTHPQDGFWFAYWSGKHIYLDGWLKTVPSVNERWSIAQSIWHAQDITRLRPLLYKNRIGAVVITKEMREGAVWDLPEQDLLFLLRNSETFKNVYRSSSVEIWAVQPPEQSQ